MKVAIFSSDAHFLVVRQRDFDKLDKSQFDGKSILDQVHRHQLFFEISLTRYLLSDKRNVAT